MGCKWAMVLPDGSFMAADCYSCCLHCSSCQRTSTGRAIVLDNPAILQGSMRVHVTCGALLSHLQLLPCSGPEVCNVDVLKCFVDWLLGSR